MCELEVVCELLSALWEERGHRVIKATTRGEETVRHGRADPPAPLASTQKGGGIGEVVERHEVRECR